MPFPMKTYRVTFVCNGKLMWDIVQAYAPHEAIRICQMRFAGATSFSVMEVV